MPAVLPGVLPGVLPAAAGIWRRVMACDGVLRGPSRIDGQSAGQAHGQAVRPDAHVDTGIRRADTRMSHLALPRGAGAYILRYAARPDWRAFPAPAFAAPSPEM